MDNTEVIKSLINNIEAGNMTDAGDDFSSALDLKLADILSARREEMANAVFNNEDAEDVQTGETNEDV
jgi:hypothetical protein